MGKHLIAIAVLSIACKAAQQPVLLELFTSEGCSSCPSADVLLEQLDRTQPLPGIQIIALSEHVDYWNHIGWQDPFSNPAFSQRQQQYSRRFRLDSVYTPQLVIDGKSEIVGNDRPGVQKAILDAAKDAKVGVRIVTSANSVQVDVDATPTEAVVMLASAESVTAVSKVARGENAGRELRHVAVVRSLKQIGVLEKGKPFTATMPVKQGTGNRRWIAFIQEGQQGRILGAAMAK